MVGSGAEDELYGTSVSLPSTPDVSVSRRWRGMSEKIRTGMKGHSQNVRNDNQLKVPRTMLNVTTLDPRLNVAVAMAARRKVRGLYCIARDSGTKLSYPMVITYEDGMMFGGVFQN